MASESLETEKGRSEVKKLWSCIAICTLGLTLTAVQAQTGWIERNGLADTCLLQGTWVGDFTQNGQDYRQAMTFAPTGNHRGRLRITIYDPHKYDQKTCLPGESPGSHLPGGCQLQQVSRQYLFYFRDKNVLEVHTCGAISCQPGIENGPRPAYQMEHLTITRLDPPDAVNPKAMVIDNKLYLQRGTGHELNETGTEDMFGLKFGEYNGYDQSTNLCITMNKVQ